MVKSKGKQETCMKLGSTFILRVFVAGLGIIVLALSIVVLHAIAKDWATEFPTLAYAKFPVFIGLSIAAAAFFFALYQTLKLLRFIDLSQAFSSRTISALKNIKYCGITIGIVFLGCLPLTYYIAEHEDAPGLILMGMFVASLPFVVSAFAALLQKLLQNAIAIKSENDLTV